MPIYHIELIFNSEMETKVLDAKKMFPHTTVTRKKTLQEMFQRTDNKPPASIILVSTISQNSEKLESLLRTFCDKHASFALSLSSLRTDLEDFGVLFLAPTTTSAFLKFHSELYDLLTRESYQIDEAYRPGSWLPRCLLVEELPKNPSEEFLGLLSQLELPYNGFAVGVRLVQVSFNRPVISNFYLEEENVSLDRLNAIGLELKRASEGYAFKLYFDEALDNLVSMPWRLLNDHGVTSALNKPISRPSITLLSCPIFQCSPELRRAIEKFASVEKSLPIELSWIEILPADENFETVSLFLNPSPSQSLLEFQTRFCDVMKLESVKIPKEYRLGAWMPRCPIALQVPKLQLKALYDIMRQCTLPVSGSMVELGLVECKPDQHEKYSFKLRV